MELKRRIPASELGIKEEKKRAKPKPALYIEICWEKRYSECVKLLIEQILILNVEFVFYFHDLTTVDNKSILLGQQFRFRVFT